MFHEPTPGSAADLAPDADPERVARTIALRRLESAPRTRAELAATLAQRQVPDDAAERVLDRFTEVGLIDDAAFARAWVTTRHAGRGLGRRVLADELRRKGVAPALIEAALAELDADGERDRARALAIARARHLNGLPQPQALRRLAGYLTRKGYSPALAFDLAREALNDSDGEGSIGVD
jgi:regulatory protein